MDTKIVPLRGPDRVRKRPAVIFGGTGADGVMTAVSMLLDLFAEECSAGHTSRVTLTQYPDGSLGIRDNGRGLFLGASDREPVWQALFCQLYAASPYGSASGSVFEANGGTVESFELCALQYASEFMDVCVIRDGFRQALHFEKGYNIGGLDRIPWGGPTGTEIRFLPDREVFSEILPPQQALAEALQALALQIPGTTAVLCRETSGGREETAFCYPNGVEDYLRCHSTADTPVYAAALSAEGRERYNKPRYAASVSIGLRFVQDSGFVKCIHNRRVLTHGGSHRDLAIHEIVRQLEWELGHTICRKTLARHLQLVIVTSSEITVWTNGARTGIENILIRDLTQDTVGEDFRRFLRENEPLLKTFLTD